MVSIKNVDTFLLSEAVTFSCMNFSKIMYLYCWSRAISNVTNGLQVLEVKFCSGIYPEQLETRGDG